MRALVLADYGRLELADVREPAVGMNEVVVRVRACGICGSDIHGMNGSTGRRVPPVIMGHEAAGEIVALGSAVTGWRNGERVTFDSTIFCGACRYCHEGLINLCDNRRVLGVSCADYRRDGAFAEYVAVPQQGLYRLPAEVSFVEAAMVEPLSVAAHAVAQAQVDAATTVAVVGTGIIGLLIIQALKVAGCGRIIAVDINGTRLAWALRMGAEFSVRSDQSDVARWLRDATGGTGVDVAFEAVGIGSTVELAIQGVRKNGTVVLVGNLESTVSFPLQSVVTRQITLRASTASCGEYPVSIEWLAGRRVDVAGLISAVAPLSEGPIWFDRLRTDQGELLKVLLEP